MTWAKARASEIPAILAVNFFNPEKGFSSKKVAVHNPKKRFTLKVHRLNVGDNGGLRPCRRAHPSIEALRKAFCVGKRSSSFIKKTAVRYRWRRFGKPVMKETGTEVRLESVKVLSDVKF